jgi:ribosomal protein L24
MDHIADQQYALMLYNHRNEEEVQGWMRDTERLAGENPDLQAKFDNMNQALEALGRSGSTPDPSYVPPDAQDIALSPEVIEAATAVAAPPKLIETAASAPAGDEDVALSPELIEAAIAAQASPSVIEPVASASAQDRAALSSEAIQVAAVPAAPKVITSLPPVPAQDQDIALSPQAIEAVIQAEKVTRTSPVEGPPVKAPVEHRVHRKAVVVPAQPIVANEPSAVRKVDGQYAVWNHGSAQGIEVGDEVKVLRGEEQIGRGQVIAVRENDCDLEISETYAVASVAVGDQVKLLARTITP